MSPFAYAVCFIFGAGLVSLWINQRFQGRNPEGMGTLAVHLITAVLVVHLVPDAGGNIVGVFSFPGRELVTLFGFIFPALVYLFLVAVWMIRWAQGTLGNRYR